jgi:hypothetical protein
MNVSATSETAVAVVGSHIPRRCGIASFTADFARAAEFVNYSHVGLVSIQHEYGIFGGDDGLYILASSKRCACRSSSHCTRC